MFPVICTLGPFPIYSFGLMLALAVIACSYLLGKEAKRELGILEDRIFDFVFWVTLAGILGSRLFFIILNLSFFMANPIEVIKIQNGGLAWQGGLILGALAGLGLIKRNGWPLLKILDLTAPYLALGQAIGRLGCFMNGCCYGKEVPWGIYFPVHQAHLHPTQLYESLGLVVIFFILKARKKFTKIEGQVFVLYLALSSLLRFINEFFRADHESFLWNLSIFQIMCLVFLGVALYVNTYLTRRFRGK